MLILFKLFTYIYLTFKHNLYKFILMLSKGHNIANVLIKDFIKIGDACHIWTCIIPELLRVRLGISVQPAQKFLCPNYLEKGIKHERILLTLLFHLGPGPTYCITVQLKTSSQILLKEIWNYAEIAAVLLKILLRVILQNLEL